MPADLLDDLIIEVAGVADQAASNAVGVLEAGEDVIDKREGGTLPELSLAELDFSVKVIDPAVVRESEVLGDVVLELDDVAVWDGLCVGRGNDGSCVVFDVGEEDWRSSCCRRKQRPRSEALHDRGGGGDCVEGDRSTEAAAGG